MVSVAIDPSLISHDAGSSLGRESKVSPLLAGGDQEEGDKYGSNHYCFTLTQPSPVKGEGYFLALLTVSFQICSIRALYRPATRLDTGCQIPDNSKTTERQRYLNLKLNS